MSITVSTTSDSYDYDWLKSTVASWLHRTDLTARIPEFIALAEDEINSELRLRMMEQTAVLTLPSGESSVALPDRYLEQIDLRLDGKELIYRASLVTSSTQSQPQFWTIQGDSIVVSHPADRDYDLTFRYMERLDIAATLYNDLLTNYRGVYLYGALLQGAAFAAKEAQVPQWASMYANLIAKVKRREGRKNALATLRTDICLPTAGFDITTG